MKRILSAIAMAMVVTSCGPDLKPNGEFGEETFVGKFHGVSIYRVETPHGTPLFIGLTEDNKPVTVNSVQSNGKTTYTVPVIIVDGKKYVPANEPENPFLK